MLDFIDWATSSQEWIHRGLLVMAATYETNKNSEEDDFVKMEPPLTSASAAAASETHANDYMTMGGYSTTAATPTVPLLSTTAEAELYLLATNFLLYVAMVIITTIVAKIYFPKSLQRGSSSGTTSFRRTSSYVALPKKGRRAFDDDDEEEAKDHKGRRAEEEILFDDLLVARESSDDDVEALYSDDDDDDEANAFLTRKKAFKDDAKEEDNNDLDDLLTEGDAGRASILEFDQEQTSRTKVVQRLLFCSLMLNLTFVTWGALQERMLTRRYPRHTGDYFTYSYALVFTNRFWTLIMSGCMWLYLKPRRSQSTVLYEYSFPAISNMLSSWCQYEALRYVSFPATTLFKSFKLAPVMLMGKILGNKSYPAYDYAVAVVIGIGIALFMRSTDELPFATDAYGNDEAVNAKWTGVMLLCLFLVFDSFTSQFQSRMFQRHPQMSMVELMLATSAFSTVLSWITLVHTQELSAALEFVYQHSEIHFHFFAFSCCSTVGQLFIYYTIKNFGAVVFTIIMTTRILLSIALSVVLYGHPVSGLGFLGLCLVMAAVLYRIKRKAEGTQLIKWQGIVDEKGPELVQEWHEHADM